ncbi:MAG: ABC transporter permease [Acidobacteriota bacterium]
MSLARDIAWRYLKRPTDQLINAVSIVSVFGLVIGVMALVISMALMTGYRGDLQEKLLGGNAELFVYSINGGIENTAATVDRIRRVPGIANVSPVLFQGALVSSEANGTGEQIMIKGVEPRRSGESHLYQKVIGPRASFRSADGYPGLSLGKYLARKLGVKAGDVVTLTAPSEDRGSFLPKSGTYTVVTVYDTGFFEFDARWIFMDLDEARQLLGLQQANLIEVKLLPGVDLDAMVKRIANLTENQYAVTDWRQMNRQLFSLLKIQQLVLFIVIGLIVFVSTFNIVSTLIMIVHEKRKEIGILAAMGADGKMVRRIFVWYGTLVGVGGTLLGMVLGCLVSWILTRFKLISFGPEIAEVYFVSSIPFVTRWQDLGAIALFAIVVSFLATLLPSMRAARLNPIDALRHE